MQEENATLINGLIIVPDFICIEEELEILSHLKNTHTKGIERSSIQRFGKMPYTSGERLLAIPDYLLPFLHRLTERGFLAEPPDSVSINEYNEGQHIGYHIDNKQSGPIVSILSLLSDAEMGFKRTLALTINIPRRSLIQLTGEARWEWKHSIKPVKSKRYSIVFRKLT